MGKRGRPLKLTNGVIKKLCDARAIGSSMRVCSLYAGISIDTLHDWIVKGEEVLAEVNNGRPREDLSDKEKIFLRFIRRWRDAEAEATVTWQQVINEAARMDPAWAYRMLRLFDAEGYSEVKRVDLTTDGKPLPAPTERIIVREVIRETDTGEGDNANG